MEYQHDMNWERSMIRNMKHDTWDGMVGRGRTGGGAQQLHWGHMWPSCVLWGHELPDWYQLIGTFC